MLIALKAVTWSAVAVLVGAALGRYWLAPPRPPRLPVLAAAALAVPLLGGAELWLTVAQLRPPDLELWWRYATTTSHGHAVAERSLAAAALAVTTLALPRAWPVAAGLAVWLLYGFSRLSHAAALGGTGPLLVDLAHLAGAAAWAGGVWYVTFAGAPRGRGPGLGSEDEAAAGQSRAGRVADDRATAGVERLSRLATWVVIGLAATGATSALFHASEPGRFFASGYAAALGVKLGLVALTLALAALNRFWLLPRARAGSGGIRAALLVESALLLGVLVATGWLTTSPVPHGQSASLDALENARRVIEHLAR